MKNKLAIWVGAAAFLWFGLLRGVKAAKVTFDKLRVIDVTANSAVYELALLVHNPTLLDMTIDRIDGTVYMMDIPVAVVDWNVAQHIRSFASSALVVQFEAFHDKIGDAAWVQIQSGDVRSLEVTFDGFITIKGVRIPVKKTFLYDDIVNNR